MHSPDGRTKKRRQRFACRIKKGQQRFASLVESGDDIILVLAWLIACSRRGGPKTREEHRPRSSGGSYISTTDRVFGVSLRMRAGLKSLHAPSW